ncbi:MAG: sigma-54-dependent Fis family transcriptional regulator, partial [Planctomycetaceae bacterium]
MKKTTVLIVDDEPSIRTTVSEALLEMGYDVDTAADGVEAINKFEKKAFEVVITDVKLPKVSGMEVLRGIKSISTHTPVIVMTGYGTVNTAVEAMKEGASDFIMKPFSAEHLELVIKDVISKNGSGAEKEGRAPSGSSSVDKAIVTGDERMLSLLKLLKNVSGSSSGILIQGESGTGKELLARYVHRYSKRSKKPFVAVN